MGIQKIPVEQLVAGDGNIGGVQFILAIQPEDGVHCGRVLNGESGNNDEIFVLGLDLRELFDPFAMEAVAPNKRIAGKKLAYRYAHPVQMAQNVVGAVSHPIHHDRLIGFLQLFPAGRQPQQRFQHF